MMRAFCLSLVLLAVFPCPGVRAAEQLKIGFVDIDRVFASYDEAEGVMEEVREIKERGGRERAELEAEITRLSAELQERAASISAQERNRRSEQIQAKMRNLMEFDRSQKVRESEPVHRALNRIYEAVEKYGESAGYGLIVEKRVGVFGRTVLFGRDELDITGEIIGILAGRGPSPGF